MDISSARIIREHPRISGFSNIGVPKVRQHLRASISQPEPLEAEENIYSIRIHT